MKAIILAGGQGERLNGSPLAGHKCLEQVGAHTPLDLIVYQPSSHDVSQVILLGGFACLLDKWGTETPPDASSGGA